jgi:hypothetical protein
MCNTIFRQVWVPFTALCLGFEESLVIAFWISEFFGVNIYCQNTLVVYQNCYHLNFTLCMKE